jgi:hypothetical protein
MYTEWFFYHYTLIISSSIDFVSFFFQNILYHAFFKLYEIFIFFTLLCNSKTTINFWFSNGNLYLKCCKIVRLFFINFKVEIISCSKLGGLRFLCVHPTGYYGCKVFSIDIITGIKFITASIVDNEFITYENMYLLVSITHLTMTTGL